MHGPRVCVRKSPAPGFVRFAPDAADQAAAVGFDEAEALRVEIGRSSKVASAPPTVRGQKICQIEIQDCVSLRHA